MKVPPLRYAAPATVAEAAVALAADEDAKIIAGGQSLMPLLAIRLAAPSVLVDLGRVRGLGAIEEHGDFLRIGAMATHREVVESGLIRRRAPLFAEAGRYIAHPQIRSRGTLGGALAHGDNAGEWPLALLTLGGMVEAESVRGRRTIDADDLFVGPYLTGLAADEVLTDVWISAVASGWGFAEAARRAGDYGLALIGVRLDIEDGQCRDARVVVGAAAGTVQRVPAAEQVLTDVPADAQTARAAGAAAADSLTFIADIHGSAAYRRHLVAGLVERAVRQAGGIR
ncbi:FAD binding domain-containing protein [Amycolatopsis sp. NPDC059090]|uniref:FAD binding domain-containing protein n=1 Tax=unclassified Amycolatopsis TaxID=2618356 RepID=UPI00366DBE38